jgi:phospholipid/cholesterol/gamma-HCH transport system substrate-binding protein
VVKGYTVKAEFLKVGGLSTGSDVRINGIKVGTVTAQQLNNEDYTVDVVMSIGSDVKLPKDSVATIVGDGLMGDKFVKIEPGKEKEYLQEGDTFAKTKDFKTLEDMVGEVIFMVTDSGNKNE